MSEAIFYKSNGNELCRCELETNQEIVFQRKKDFEKYLDERQTPSKNKKTSYKNLTYQFFANLFAHKLLMLNNIFDNFDNLLYQISDIDKLFKIKNAMLKTDGDVTYQKLNDDRQKNNGSASACIGIYIEFLEKEEQTQIISDDEFDIFLKNLYIKFREKLPAKKSFLELQNSISPFITVQGEVCDFFITKDKDFIVAVFEDKELIFDEKEFDCYLINSIDPKKDKQAYPKYSSPVFDLILHQNNLVFDDSEYWFVTSEESNLKTESVINEARFNKWKKPLDGMKNGKTVFIYVNEPIKAFYALGKLDNTDKEFFDISNITLLSTPIRLKEIESIRKKVQYYGKLRNRKLINYLLYRLHMIAIGKEEMIDSMVGHNTNKSDTNLKTDFPLNQILYGSPGTGKTYSTIDKALEILGVNTKAMSRQDRKDEFEKYRKNKQIEFVTFHQSYGYEEFVEGIKPLTDENKNVYYEVTNGIFKELCKRAQESQKKHILIIDEINRGNISKIFGELITLIEPSKRIGESEELRVALPYSTSSGNGEKELFGVPNNLYIIGTMNTADRSITSLDTALRRRFEFVEMMPEPSKLSDIRVLKDKKETEINLSTMLEIINKRIEFLYDREKTIGHAFFLKDEGQKSLDITELKSIFQNKIIPLLQEYFYNDYAQIQAVLNCNKMIEGKKETIKNLFVENEQIRELDLEDKIIYQIAKDDSEIWNKPETYIAIYDNQVAQQLNKSKSDTENLESKEQ